MNKKEITAIVMYWYPYVGAVQPIYKALFTHLSKSGYTTSIIAGIPHYRKGRQELWPEYRGIFRKESIEDGLQVKRVFVFSPRIDIGFDKNGVVRRFINYFSFFISAFLAILTDKKSKPSLFFAVTSPPFFGGLLAYVASKIKKVPFVYNVQDLHPDILFSLKIFRVKPIAYFLGGIERFVYSRAQHITVLSNKMKETLHKKGVPLKKMTVIPNFCDTEFTGSLSKDNDFAKEYGLNARFNVFYAGNMGQPQGLESVIKAAKILKDRPDILFVFVGSGEKKQDLQRLAGESDLTNVIFIPLQPFERMSLVWASADISLISLRKNISHLAFPSKTYSILSSGRPLVAMVDKDSEIWEFVKASGGGLCVESEDYKDLADKIISLYKDPARRKEMGQKGRRFIENNFSKQRIVSEYKTLFDEVCLSQS
ncbi:glycosyltransferase family 4 protein [Candidatus Omnitrophota bacterium]